MSLRVGVIGAGYMGRVHSQILKQDPRVKIVGVVDVKKEMAESLARLLNVEVFSSLEDLVNEAIDAVYITTPNTTHFRLAQLALKNNVHVFCEKPMATSLSEAKILLELGESANVIYQVGHNRRFAPVYKFVKDLIVKREFIPYSAQIKMNRGELKNPSWVSHPEITGGFLYESTIHLLDMARWLMGEIEWVDCIGRTNVYSEMDSFVLLLTFTSGKIANFFSSAHASWVFPFERIELFGKHSSVVTEEMRRVTYCPGLEEEIVVRDYFQYPEIIKWGYLEEDQRFINVILKGEKAAVSAQDGYKSVELVEACYRSARKNKKIKLPLLDEE